MTRSFVLKTAGVVLAVSLLLGGGLLGLRFDTAPQATAAPVPKVEMAKADDITDVLAELVSQPAVQRELKLTADQRLKLIDGFDKLEEEWQKGAAAPAPGGAAGPALATAEWEKNAQARRELAAGTLTKAQATRLQQCEVQVLGPLALKLKRVADALKLTDEQQQAADKLIETEVGGGVAGGVPQAVLPPLPVPAKQPDDAFADILKGFSPTQAKAWKELTGDIIGFDKQRALDRCPAVAALASLGLGGVVPPLPPPAPGNLIPGGPVPPPAQAPLPRPQAIPPVQPPPPKP